MANTSELQLVLEAPKFSIPMFSDHIRKREATVPPREYEKAEQLKSLLENDNTAEALVILNSFYDIELSPALLMLKAQIYFHMKDYEKAERVYKTVLARSPQLVRAHNELGRLYLITEDTKKARHHFSQAVNFGASDAMTYGQLAYLNLHEHNSWSAINAYQQALSIQPENRQWQIGLSQALAQAKQTESALALISELVEQNQGEAQLWLRRAGLALQADDTQTAIASLEAAIRLGGVEPINQQIAAQLHFQQGNYDRGVELLNTTIQSGHLDLAVLDQALSWLVHHKRIKHAKSLLSEATKHSSKFSQREQAQIYFHQAKIAQGEGKISKSIQLAEKSINIDPNYGKALISLAELHLRKENFVKAELYYTRAETIDSVRQQATIGKAQVYIDSLDYASALTQLKIAYRKYPERQDLKTNIAIIENTLEAREQTKI